jgi:hypothetical protein
MRIAVLVAVLCVVAGAVDARQRVEVGAQTSLGIQQEMLGSGPPSHVTLGLVQLQLPVTLIFAETRPRLQVINEGILGGSLHPSQGLFLGLAETLRVHLRPGQKVGWYVEAGAGICSVALRVHELDGQLQYTLHAGGGMRIETGPGSLVLGYRLTHFSNNGIVMPNLGLNLHTMVIGYTIPLN